MIRKGKIGRLPPALREQRLGGGEPNSTLVPRLNSLPEVQTLLASDFHGQPPLLSAPRPQLHQNFSKTPAITHNCSKTI